MTESVENDVTRTSGGWNYRICRETIDGEFFFTLREVYYDDGGNPNGWTAEPIDFAGDSWRDVAEGISLASRSIGSAILDLDTREWIKPGPKSSTRVLSPATPTPDPTQRVAPRNFCACDEPCEGYPH